MRGPGAHWYEMICLDAGGFCEHYLKLVNTATATTFEVFNGNVNNNLVTAGDWNVVGDTLVLTNTNGVVSTLLPKTVTVNQVPTLCFSTTNAIVPGSQANSTSVLFFRGMNYTPTTPVQPYYRDLFNTPTLYNALVAQLVASSLSVFSTISFNSTSFVVVPGIISPIYYPQGSISVDTTVIDSIARNNYLERRTAGMIKEINNQLLSEPSIATFLSNL